MNREKQLFVIFGPPGSGKGSLSALCVKEWGWKQLSTGNRCRQLIASNSDIGRQIDFAIKSGKLVSDDLITTMIEESLLEFMVQEAPIILDGYPRNLAQAFELDRILNKDFFKNTGFNVITLKVTERTVMHRMTGRLVCSHSACQAVYSEWEDSLNSQKPMECDVCAGSLIKRTDDNEEVMRDRLLVYYEHEKKIIDHYRQHGFAVHELNAERPLSEVFNELKLCIGRKRNDYH